MPGAKRGRQFGNIRKAGPKAERHKWHANGTKILDVSGVCPPRRCPEIPLVRPEGPLSFQRIGRSVRAGMFVHPRVNEIEIPPCCSGPR